MESSPKASKSEIKTFFGKCRCCLEYGYMKSMWSEYERDGFREIYGEMLMETFSVTWQSLDDSQDYICESCVLRLQDAYDFKKGVLASEQLMYEDLDEMEETAFKVDALEEFEEIEQENVLEDDFEGDKASASETEYYDVEYLDDDVEINEGTSDPSILREEILSEQKAKEAEWPQKKTKRVYKNYSEEVMKQCVKAVIENRMAVGEASKFYGVPRQTVFDKLNNKKPGPIALPNTMPRTGKLRDNNLSRSKFSYKRVTEKSEKIAQIKNVSTILEYSNLIPFRSRNSNGFPCFYCRHLFDNLETLREHTREHKKNDVKKVLRSYGAERLVVYADVTNLCCTICNMAIPNLNELKIHLTRKHKKSMYLDYNDRVIPFKLATNNVYECQICGLSFETFGSIERHMNVHFSNYLCKDCGKGFVTKSRMKSHLKNTHEDGNFPCEICKKIFSTQQKVNNHVKIVHKLVKRFKCTKCPERFSEYPNRQKHMVVEHGCAPVRYKCNICSKTFERKSKLTRHMKRDHLKERNTQCNLCSYKCFASNELRLHMVKHIGERIYDCSVCKKSYARKNTLKQHMKIHNNDRRFACAVCGQTFLRKCSLIGHLKRHQQ